jgi:hypothetical protein
MPSYKIVVDHEIWQFLKNHAEPFEDTPNSVLKRLLLGKKANGQDHVARIHTPTDLPDFHGVPRALAQIFEVIYGVHKLRMSRTEATNAAAQKRNTAPQTIIDKYCRQLGKHAHDVDELLRPENLNEFRLLLEQRFHTHKAAVKKFFDALPK